jgi:hypothetical protein
VHGSWAGPRSDPRPERRSPFASARKLRVRVGWGAWSKFTRAPWRTARGPPLEGRRRGRRERDARRFRRRASPPRTPRATAFPGGRRAGARPRPGPRVPAVSPPGAGGGLPSQGPRARPGGGARTVGSTVRGPFRGKGRSVRLPVPGTPSRARPTRGKRPKQAGSPNRPIHRALRPSNGRDEAHWASGAVVRQIRRGRTRSSGGKRWTQAQG